MSNEISSHGKGKVDNAGGISKVAITREVAAGMFLSTAEQMVIFSKTSFLRGTIIYSGRGYHPEGWMKNEL